MDDDWWYNWRITLIILLLVKSTTICFQIQKLAKITNTWALGLDWSGKVTCTALGGVGRLPVTANCESTQVQWSGQVSALPLSFYKEGIVVFFFLRASRVRRAALCREHIHIARRRPMSQPCQRWRPRATCISTQRAPSRGQIISAPRIRLSRLLSVACNNCCACWPLTHNRNTQLLYFHFVL
jgi:hypothetical protein